MTAERSHVNTHVVTLCSRDRRTHVERQIAALAHWAPEVTHHTVMIGEQPFQLGRTTTVDRTGAGPVNLAAARNAGGDAAAAQGAELLIFLDADCVPGPDLVCLYRREAATQSAPGVLCGPVTYLPQNTALPASEDLDRPEALEHLVEHTAPHAARPAPAPGQVRTATHDEYTLFWSLSFAMTAPLWGQARAAFGGFCEEFTGYGGEDTDFAMNLRRTGIPMSWVGGAHAYHQWHPVSSPPVEHLEEILANAQAFHDRWGFWPMTGWLEAFERLELVRFTNDAWQRTPTSEKGSHL